MLALLKQHQKTLAYLFFGGMTFLVSVLTYALFSVTFKLNLTLAYSLSWFLAVLFAYVTNRFWVFEHQAHTWPAIFQEAWRFCLARIITGLIGGVILFFGVQILGQNGLIWNALQNIFVILANYVLSNRYIFQEKQS